MAEWRKQRARAKGRDFASVRASVWVPKGGGEGSWGQGRGERLSDGMQSMERERESLCEWRWW
jgi:hypothetical protein